MSKRKEPYLDGNSYFDDPNLEQGCKELPNERVRLDEQEYIYPCYVYDGHGKFLRVEYPKHKLAQIKWTSRY